MSTSDSKVVVNYVSDLSSSKKLILFLSFLFLQTDLLFEVGILDGFVQWRSTSRNWSRGFEFIHLIDHLHFFDPLHSLRGKIGTRTRLGFESYLPKKWWWSGEFVELKPGFCSLRCPAIEFCGTSTGKEEFMVDGFLSDIGIVIVLTCRDRSPCTYLHWNRTCSTWSHGAKNSLTKCLRWNEHRTWIAKNVSLWFR